MRTSRACVSALVMVAALGGALPAARAQPAGPPPGGPGGPGADQPDTNVVQGVAFTGSTRFSQAELRQATFLMPGETISRPKVKRDLDAITALYRGAGDTVTKVAPNITHPAPGKVVVTYQIHEG